MYRNVMLAYDGSACARLALQEALQMAEQGACLTVVMLALTGSSGPGLSTLHSELSQQLAGQMLEAGLVLVPVTAASEAELVAALLAEAAAQGCNLMVLGLPASGGQPRSLLGRHAERLSREAPCPVLLVRSPEPSFSCLNPAEVYGMWPDADDKPRID